ncbi:MAG: endonuclease/exonuclease/phosphatase family protein [Candidatus Obscuribacterales bacterium]|nr:endonuclease/exonuclease/phosphatase family protein [Candidatus Obscuribacterales bacterium]
MRILLIFVNALAIIATTLSMAGSVADYGNIAELCASVRLALIIVLIVAALIAGLLRAQRTVISMSALTIICFLSLTQFFPANKTNSAPAGTPIRILEMNLWGGRNHSKDAIIKEIKLQDADLICMSEITDSLLSTLKNALPNYRYVIAEPRYGGVALFSRMPLRESSIEHCSNAQRSRIVALVSKNNVTIKVLCVHPKVPIKTQELRDKELAIIASELQHSKEPVILVGDLNLTPFSYHFKKLLEDANLLDSEKGFGILPTWNAFMPLSLLPIDHCLTSPSFSTTNRKLGNAIGSDHFPLVVDLVYTGQ